MIVRTLLDAERELNKLRSEIEALKGRSETKETKTVESKGTVAIDSILTTDNQKVLHQLFHKFIKDVELLGSIQTVLTASLLVATDASSKLVSISVADTRTLLSVYSIAQVNAIETALDARLDALEADVTTLQSDVANKANHGVYAVSLFTHDHGGAVFPDASTGSVTI